MGTPTRIVVGALLVSGAMALAACGGGGGGDPSGPEAALSGSYVYVYLDRDVASDEVVSEVATFSADGAGSIVFQQGWRCGGGAADVTVRRANAAYDVDDARDLEIPTAFPGPLWGTVSSGGRYLAAIAPDAGEDPGWLCALRRDTNPSLSDLVGSWHVVEWSRLGSSPDHAVSLTARVTVDGAGNVTHAEVHYNEDGAIDPGAVLFLPTHFQTGGPGGLSVVFEGAPAWHGGLSANGDVILLGRRTSPFAGLRVLVREGAAAGAGSVQGRWEGSGFAAARPGYMCSHAVVEFDGAGDGTWLSSGNLDGTLGAGMTLPMEYGIGIDGQAVLIRTGPISMSGGAASRFLLYGGPLTVDRGPCVYVLVR